MVLGVNSGTVAGDPQHQTIELPEDKKERNPGFMHWFNKQMPNLQREFMEENHQKFMDWCEKKWKS